MIQTEPHWLTGAEMIARQAHRGQVDKGGFAYINHPRRVAEAVAERAHPSFTEQAVATAWLHDVVEDTFVSLTDLVRCGIPPMVVGAVDAITHRHREPRDEYLARVATNRVARVVKWCDVQDNLSPDRLAQLDEVTQVRLRRKYHHTLELIS